jgi:hypothetical protein
VQSANDERANANSQQSSEKYRLRERYSALRCGELIGKSEKVILQGEQNGDAYGRREKDRILHACPRMIDNRPQK